MKKFIQQYTQASREIILPLPVADFERAFRQHIYLRDAEQLDTPAFKPDKENDAKKYYGWMSAYQFYVRPVFSFLNRSSIYFIVEGTYSRENDNTKVKYTIKPSAKSLAVGFYFYTALAIIGFGMSLYLYNLTKNNILIINALICIPMPVLFTIFPYRMYIKDAFQAFESDLMSLEIAKHA